MMIAKFTHIFVRNIIYIFFSVSGIVGRLQRLIASHSMNSFPISSTSVLEKNVLLEILHASGVSLQ